MSTQAQKTKRPAVARYPLGMPPSLKKALQKIAKENRRSLNLQIVTMLEEHPEAQAILTNGKQH